MANVVAMSTGMLAASKRRVFNGDPSLVTRSRPSTALALGASKHHKRLSFGKQGTEVAKLPTVDGGDFRKPDSSISPRHRSAGLGKAKPAEPVESEATR